jgi:hypothetical protein
VGAGSGRGVVSRDIRSDPQLSALMQMFLSFQNDLGIVNMLAMTSSLVLVETGA